MHDLIRFYTKQLKMYCDKFAQQELIISKLQSHIAVNLKHRFEDKIRIRQASTMLFMSENEDVEPHLPGFMRRQFDFYGMNVRMNHEDLRYHTGDVLLREKEVELNQMREENGDFETGSIVEWIVFEIVAFYVNLLELTIQSLMYSNNTFKMVEFIYTVKLVTRI